MSVEANEAEDTEGREQIGVTALARTVWRQAGGRIGLVILLVLFAMAAFLPLVWPTGEYQQLVGRELEAPSLLLPFGTDQVGRDIFIRTMYGLRASFVIAVASALLGGLVGMVIGVIVPVVGRFTEAVILRSSDVLLAIPTILVGIVIVGFLGPSVGNLILALSLRNVPIFVRLARAGALEVFAQEYIDGARAVGVSGLRLLRRHVLPNVLPPLIVQFGIAIAFTVFAEAALSFLGFGVQPPDASLGTLLGDGRGFIRAAPWMTVAPGLILALFIVGINLTTDALRDVLDPSADTRI